MGMYLVIGYVVYQITQSPDPRAGIYVIALGFVALLLDFALGGFADEG